MNLAIRGYRCPDCPRRHVSQGWTPRPQADYVLANPPFNDSDWRGELLKDDKRWVYGTPPAGNANYAWVQHFIHHLAPYGIAGFVLANGSMSSNQSGEGRSARRSSRPIWSTAWSRYRGSCSTRPRSRCAVVSDRSKKNGREDAPLEIGVVRPCSSTPGR